jgi:tetratricopeptide (TPR) repeat protein
MKKFLLLQILFIAFLLIFFELPSYGAGDFSQYYNKGIEYYKQGKYDLAGKEFEKAIEIKPNDVYALYGLGNTYYCKSKYDDAVKAYTKAININPDYAKVHYSLSLAYSKLGMTREAEKQKSIFRKLSQGGDGASQEHAESTVASTHSSADHAPKKNIITNTKKNIT